MQTIVYQCDTAMPAQKLPNCCIYIDPSLKRLISKTSVLDYKSRDGHRLIIPHPPLKSKTFKQDYLAIIRK